MDSSINQKPAPEIRDDGSVVGKIAIQTLFIALSVIVIGVAHLLPGSLLFHGAPTLIELALMPILGYLLGKNKALLSVFIYFSLFAVVGPLYKHEIPVLNYAYILYWYSGSVIGFMVGAYASGFLFERTKIIDLKTSFYTTFVASSMANVFILIWTLSRFGYLVALLAFAQFIISTIIAAAFIYLTAKYLGNFKPRWLSSNNEY